MGRHEIIKAEDEVSHRRRCSSYARVVYTHGRDATTAFTGNSCGTTPSCTYYVTFLHASRRAFFNTLFVSRVSPPVRGTFSSPTLNALPWSRVLPDPRRSRRRARTIGTPDRRRRRPPRFSPLEGPAALPHPTKRTQAYVPTTRLVGTPAD